MTCCARGGRRRCGARRGRPTSLVLIPAARRDPRMYYTTAHALYLEPILSICAVRSVPPLATRPSFPRPSTGAARAAAADRASARGAQHARPRRHQAHAARDSGATSVVAACARSDCQCPTEADARGCPPASSSHHLDVAIRGSLPLYSNPPPPACRRRSLTWAPALALHSCRTTASCCPCSPSSPTPRVSGGRTGGRSWWRAAVVRE